MPEPHDSSLSFIRMYINLCPELNGACMHRGIEVYSQGVKSLDPRSTCAAFSMVAL